jgi:molecular chaperone DnaK
VDTSATDVVTGAGGTLSLALLLDVTPAALRVATAGGYAEPLLEKNSPIPIEHTRVFTTARDHQTRVVIDCCRGESRRAEENEVLGTLVLENLPPGPRGEAKVEVTFRVDADGILHVRAIDVRTGMSQEARLNVIGAPIEDGIPEIEDLPEPT